MILQLAPMEGVVDALIRDIYTNIGGYNLCTTEFVRVTFQKLPAKVFYRYCPELHIGGKTRAGVPVFVQLLGSDPVMLAENALVAVSLGAKGIDLNFGCPAKTVNKHDGGASLLKEPSRIYAIVDHLRKQIPSEIPLSAKVRLGFEDKSKCLEIAAAVEQGGASFLGVHARTKLEAYKAPAHWEYIAMMRESVDLPVLANGDIWNVADWQRCKQVSGCSDFLLGRGAFAFPQLANEIHRKNQTYNKELSKMEKILGRNGKLPSDDSSSFHSWEDTYKLYLAFLKTSNEVYGAQYTNKRAKQWIKFLTKTYPEAGLCFEDTKRMKSVEEMFAFHINKHAPAEVPLAGVYI